MACLSEKRTAIGWMSKRPWIAKSLGSARLLQFKHARTIITKNSSPDVGFTQSINTFSGCEHGCIYCFARPTHAFHDLSPGIDFETRLFAKPGAAELLRGELAKPGYVAAPDRDGDEY